MGIATSQPDPEELPAGLAQCGSCPLGLKSVTQHSIYRLSRSIQYALGYLEGSANSKELEDDASEEEEGVQETALSPLDQTGGETTSLSSEPLLSSFPAARRLTQCAKKTYSIPAHAYWTTCP